MKAIPKISSLLNMGQEELEKESVKAYLHIKLRHGEIRNVQHCEKIRDFFDRRI